jgi:hypothetical protein
VVLTELANLSNRKKYLRGGNSVYKLYYFLCNIIVIKDGMGRETLNTERGLFNTIEQKDGRIQRETIQICQQKMRQIALDPRRVRTQKLISSSSDKVKID